MTTGPETRCTLTSLFSPSPPWLLVRYFMPLVSHSLLLLACQPSLQHLEEAVTYVFKHHGAKRNMENLSRFHTKQVSCAGSGRGSWGHKIIASLWSRA